MTSPFAVWLLPSYHANIFMTTLFALIDPSLSVIEATYSILVYDAVYTLEEHWDTMIDAIQIGVLPDIYELGEYRPHIEVGRFDFYSFSYRRNFHSQGYFKPLPDRAQELRKIEKGAEGWLKRVWPSLTAIKTTFGCVYAAPVPKVCST